MYTQDPIKLAKSGDVEAIDFLIKRALKAKGIKSKTTERGGSLYVALQADFPLKQEKIVGYLESSFRKLNPKNVDKIRIASYEPVSNTPLWNKTIALKCNQTRIDTNYDIATGSGNKEATSETSQPALSVVEKPDLKSAIDENALLFYEKKKKAIKRLQTANTVVFSSTCIFAVGASRTSDLVGLILALPMVFVSLILWITLKVSENSVLKRAEGYVRRRNYKDALPLFLIAEYSWTLNVINKTRKTIAIDYKRLITLFNNIDLVTGKLGLEVNTNRLRTIVRELITVYQDRKSFGWDNRLKAKVQARVNQLVQEFDQEREKFQRQFQSAKEQSRNYKKYEDVPWHRRSIVVGPIAVFGLCFYPLYLGVCILCMTGEIYCKKKINNRLYTWKKRKKFLYVMLILNFMWILEEVIKTFIMVVNQASAG